MTKYTMTQASAKRIAKTLLRVEETSIAFYITADEWKKALQKENYSTQYLASTASSVLRELRNAEMDATAEALERKSFEALFHELEDVRRAGTKLLSAFGTLGRHRL